MFRNYLITAWRNIIKNGMFSILNIAGLAIGLTSCILIMLFVREETGFDTWLTDNDRLVRMHTAYSFPNQQPFETVRSAGNMMEAIRDYASNEIESGVRLIQFETTVRQNENAFSEQATMVDGSFFKLFDLPFAHGSEASSFNKPMDLVITEEIALKYFGKTDVIGKSLTLCCYGGGPTSVAITGIIKDLPKSTHLDINFLLYLQPALFGENDNVLHTWTSVNVYTYFKLNEGISLEQLENRISYWMNNESPLKDMFTNSLNSDPQSKQVTDLIRQRLMRVPDLHLNAKDHAGNLGDLTPMGDSQLIKTFVIVAGLVLLIACINFMNLSTAKASKRAKEVAMRKVLGASRIQVAIQFLGEAIALVLISLLFALVTVEMALPFYNQVLGLELVLRLFDDFSLLASLIGLAILVGLGAGLYPAMYLSRFLPGDILKSSKSGESGSSNKLRNILVIFQFTTSIVLVISTLVVYGQTLYSNNKDVGFSSNNKLVLDIAPARDKLASLKQELLNIPDVKSVVYSSESPTQDNENNTGFKLLDSLNGTANQSIGLNYYNMGYGFFEAYDIKPIAGRLFDEAFGSDKIITENNEQAGKASILLNEMAIKKFGFDSPQHAIGKTIVADIAGMQHLTIIGVIPDIHFRSIKFGIRASVYTFNPQRFRVATITYDSYNVAKLMNNIGAVWKNNIPMRPISLQFLTEMMKAQYEDEVTMAQLFLVFSILAIIVACLGLFGLSAFTVERRTKEIGIRKVMGAGVKDIVSLLIWQFSKPVILANIIAWPTAIYFMITWLETFPHRMNILWLIPICIFVGLLSLVIAWGTVGANAAKVARKNPVHALKYE